MESWVVGARACYPSARNGECILASKHATDGECSCARNGRSVARSKVGESASCVGQWVGSVFFRAKSEKRSLARQGASKEVGTDRWNGVN